MSDAPKPVTVLLCFGLLKPGPIGPAMLSIGPLVDGFRTRGEEGFIVVAIV